MALAVEDLVELGLPRPRTRCGMEGDNLVVAGHDRNGARLQPFAKCISPTATRSRLPDAPPRTPISARPPSPPPLPGPVGRQTAPAPASRPAPRHRRCALIHAPTNAISSASSSNRRTSGSGPSKTEIVPFRPSSSPSTSRTCAGSSRSARRRIWWDGTVIHLQRGRAPAHVHPLRKPGEGGWKIRWPRSPAKNRLSGPAARSRPAAQLRDADVLRLIDHRAAERLVRLAPVVGGDPRDDLGPGHDIALLQLRLGALRKPTTAPRADCRRSGSCGRAWTTSR